VFKACLVLTTLYAACGGQVIGVFKDCLELALGTWTESSFSIQELPGVGCAVHEEYLTQI